MARYWIDYAAEVAAATAAEIKNQRAAEVAGGFDEDRVGRLISNFIENPTAPVDLQLSLVDEPFEVRDQVTLAAAQQEQEMPDDDNGSLFARGRSWLGSGFDAAYDATKSQSRAISPILEYQPQMLQAGFRNVAGVAEDPSRIKGLAARAGLQVLTGGSPVPGQSAVDPNANLLKDLIFDDEALIDRFQRTDSNGEIRPGSPLNRLLAGTSFLETDLGQITREVAETGRLDRTDWGDGFFISRESEVMRRRDLEMRRHGEAGNGGVITAGNWAADTAGFNPEGNTYMALATSVDLGIEIAGGGAVDEMLDVGVRGAARGLLNNPVLQGSSRADFLRGAGGHAGRYYQVDLPSALNWLNGETGTATAEWLAKSDSVDDIFRRTRGQYSPDVLVRLADADNADDVKTVLMDAFAGAGAAPEFRSLPGYRVHQFTAGRRLFGETPHGVMDISDHGQSLTTIDQLAQSLSIPADMRAQWVDNMARAADPGSRYHVYADAMSDVEVRLISDFSEGGFRVNPDTAQKLTTFNRAQVNKTRIAIDDLISESMTETSWSKLTLDGNEWQLPSAHLLAERAEVLALPNMRELRRVTGSQRLFFEAIEVGSDMSTATQNLLRFTNAVLPSASSGRARAFRGVPRAGDAIEFGLEGLEAIQGIWKVTRLIRPAFPVRVVGIDEAARLDAAGHPSMWSHPISFFSDMLHANKMTDLSGDLLQGTDEFIAARAGRSGRQPRVPVDQQVASKTDIGRAEIWTPTEGFNEVTGRERFIHAWRQQIEKFGNDRVAQTVVRADSSSDALIELMSTKYGRDQIQEVMNMHPGLINSDQDMIAYLDSVRRRAASLSGSNTQILDFLKGSKAESGRWAALDGFDLDGLVDDFAPQNVVVDVPLSRDSRSMYDRALSSVFEMLASRPTNRFSRSPVFRNAYRDAIIELAPLTDDVDGLLRAAEASGVFHGADADGLRVIRQTSSTTGAQMTPEMLDQFAKQKALTEVQDLLYDLTRSNEFFHTYQQVFPFGEAWKEGVTTWFRLIKDNPFRIQRRVQALGEAASDAGVFHENQYGQTVFTYPGSASFMKATTGTPFALEGGVRNLNLMGEGAPGLGPGVQQVAQAFIPSDPSWDWVRKIALPYGDPESPRDAMTWITPAFARRIWTGLRGPFTPDEERIFANTQFLIQQHMLSTGEYSTNTKEELNDLIEESRVRAAKLYLIRGLVQATAPASPLVRAQVLGPDGELVETQALVDRYYDLLEEDPDTALEKFVDEVGMENILLIGKNTLATVHGGIPLNGDGYDWVRENPEVVDDHHQLFGFFAPQTPGGEFNSEAYSRSLDEGLIEPLQPIEKLHLVNHRIASTLYRNARTNLYARIQAAGRSGPNEEEAEWLRQLKSRLSDEWPGYATADTIGKLPTVLDVIDDGDVERALEDPLLAETPAGQGLAEYWAQRQMLIDTADRAGILTTLNGQDGGWRKSDDMLAHRQWLIGVGDGIAADNPDFREMWDSFLSRELRHDGTE